MYLSFFKTNDLSKKDMESIGEGTSKLTLYIVRIKKEYKKILVQQRVPNSIVNPLCYRI